MITITKDEVDQFHRIGRRIDDTCDEIASELNQPHAHHVHYLCANFIEFNFRDFVLPDKAAIFPVAVLWDPEVRAAEIAKWKAENDPETKERAEFERLKSKFCTNPNPCMKD